MKDMDDQDWGTGSFDLDEAKAMVRRYRQNYPESYIAVIDDGDDPVCVDEIHNIDD